MYLLHWENEHPAELEKARKTKPELRPVQEQPVKAKSAKRLAGYNGALAQNASSSCHHSYLGMFGMSKEVAQGYLRHVDLLVQPDLETSALPRMNSKSQCRPPRPSAAGEASNEQQIQLPQQERAHVAAAVMSVESLARCN